MKSTMFGSSCCGTKSAENPKENALQRKKAKFSPEDGSR
jgi:hypothetical protein